MLLFLLKASIFGDYNKFRNDEYSRLRLEESGADASDYSTVFLPWYIYEFL